MTADTPKPPFNPSCCLCQQEGALAKVFVTSDGVPWGVCEMCYDLRCRECGVIRYDRQPGPCLNPACKGGVPSP